MSKMASNAGGSKQQRLAHRAHADVVWNEFAQICQTEEDAMKYLEEFSPEEDLGCCHFCNSSDTEMVDLRSFKCFDCRKVSFYTAGTFFDHAKRIRAWVGAIYLFEKGVNFSACHLAELAGIAKSTATCIVKKLSLVIYRTMEDAEDAINSSEFSQIFIRRSLCTPALEHPRAEQKCAEEEYLANSPEKQIATHNKLLDGLSKVEMTIYNHLTPTPQDLDTLGVHLKMEPRVISAAVTSLVFTGLIEHSFGDNYFRPKHKIFVPSTSNDRNCPPKQLIYPNAIVQFVQFSMHGIARKYLQLYVAKYLTLADRTKWGSGSILSACRRSEPIYLSEIEKFVTPLFVKVGRLTVAA
jgi:hypothetical protein